ncbi:MAG: glycoside hydrolase family 88 protein, partial [Ferruginibacter sp.]|nr:glycoside hydrolase family 88 protein [Ferruginibacter sp.]
MFKQYCLFLACVCMTVSTTIGQQLNASKALNAAEPQVLHLLAEVEKQELDPLHFPRTIQHDSLKLVVSRDWTSGFWPGILWLMYEHSGKSSFKASAEKFTGLMVKERTNNDSHDVGFKVYCSYGNGYRLTQGTEYRDAIIEAAATLATRFNSRIGSIRSWNNKAWAYPVIIDNMMNLELLFAATKLSGDSSFYKIAVTHASTTLKNHYRPDFSSYHVVDYDSLTGNIIRKNTAQGYAEESAWARGQAWGLYGFTMCYRETKDVRYLRQAEGIADFILNHPNLPSDLIPLWDHDVPEKNGAPRDVSAAAITASALLELGNYSKNRGQYFKAANDILENIS